jgi:hypothetical protein
MDLYFFAVISGIITGVALGCATGAAVLLVSELWDYLAGE